MAFGAPEAIAYLTSKGVPLRAAQGMVANYKAESGLNPGINEINPTVAGSRGGYGLYQLTGPRRRAYEAWASEQGRALDDPYAQMDYNLQEFQTTERPAYEALMATDNAEDAARVMSERFLRPGIPNMDHRLSYAREMAGIGPGSGGAPGTPGALSMGTPAATPYEPDRVDALFGKLADTGFGKQLGLDPTKMQRGSDGRAGLVSGLMGLGSNLMGEEEEAPRPRLARRALGQGYGV